MTATPHITLTPLRPALLTGEEQTLEVLLRVHAPEAPEPSSHATSRSPLALALVLDRSGSMRGRPLEEAIRCAHFVTERLHAGDLLSVVSYGDEVRVEVPLQHVGRDRTLIHHLIDRVHSRGCTALFAGWDEGVGQLLHTPESSVQARVLLLSDGRANLGPTDPDVLATDCAERASQGVQTSTYGLGRGFNEDLMVAMARAGGGSHYYGQTADDLMDPFQEELELLELRCASGLRVRFTHDPRIQVEVRNRLHLDAQGSVCLPDLAYGGEAWALLRLTVPADLARTRQPFELIRVAGDAFGRDGAACEFERVRLSLPCLAQPAYSALVEDPAVAQRSLELDAADLQERARHAARRGAWAEVDELLDTAMERFAQHKWLIASLHELRDYARARRTERFAKEARYSSAKLRMRLAAEGEDSQVYSARAESVKARFLRRKLEQGKAMPRREGE